MEEDHNLNGSTGTFTDRMHIMRNKLVVNDGSFVKCNSTEMI